MMAGRAAEHVGTNASMSDEGSLPTGRLGRLARLAALGARTGASLVASKTGEAAATRAAEVLGNMRGLAAKVGQMASYVDGMVPEAHRDAYESALTKLRAAAPTSSPAAIRATVESELGAPIEELFASFDEEACASASIGQVHRAFLHDGREVAVKVQHQGIAAAVEADLANVGMLERFASFGPMRRLDAKSALDQVRARFREELDYRLEAERQRFFAELHAGDPLIVIPDVIDDRSADRVLTTTFMRGRTLEEVAQASEAERRLTAETLWRFVFKGNLVGGLFNADPHPGNYVFLDDGKIAFLDHGCCQPIPTDHLAGARSTHRAAIARDEAEFARMVPILVGTKPGRWQEWTTAYSRRCFEPLFGSPYRITRTWTANLMEGVQQAQKIALAVPASEFTPLPPTMVFMNRLQFGFYSVLARLDVAADYAEVERLFLREAGLL
jgi:predicted unusual protein kinase regulating ubiquinone biosynthesis (AarF/ABC1/UbiB family)